MIAREQLDKIIKMAEERATQAKQHRASVEAHVNRLLAKSVLSEAEKITVDHLQLSLADDSDPTSAGRAPYFNNRQKARDLGARLHAIGGRNLMRRIADMVPFYDQRELDMVWDGVGGWKA